MWPFILVVSSASVAAGSFDKSTGDRNRATLEFSGQSAVDLTVAPETTNMKLVAR
jgi:hypothetical protein